MSLKSRSIVFLLFLSSALLAWSCGGEPQSPGNPSRLVMTGPSGQQQDATDVPVFTESSETSVDPADEDPPPEEPKPEPGPAPGPPKPPEPPPADPNFPFNPGAPPKPAPGAPVPEPPTTSHPLLEIKILPSVVVPFSGKLLIDVPACRDSFAARDNTWSYQQVIATRSGIGVTINERINYFDGRYTSTNKQSIRIGGNSTHTIDSKWCSGTRIFHFVQSQYKIRDDNGNNFTFNGQWVRLYPNSW